MYLHVSNKGTFTCSSKGFNINIMTIFLMSLILFSRDWNGELCFAKFIYQGLFGIIGGK